MGWQRFPSVKSFLASPCNLDGLWDLSFPSPAWASRGETWPGTIPSLVEPASQVSGLHLELSPGVCDFEWSVSGMRPQAALFLLCLGGICLYLEALSARPSQVRWKFASSLTQVKGVSH